jgi:hypothetical protein
MSQVIDSSMAGILKQLANGATNARRDTMILLRQLLSGQLRVLLAHPFSMYMLSHSDIAAEAAAVIARVDIELAFLASKNSIDSL